jgi:chromosome segregation ATPase
MAFFKSAELEDTKVKLATANEQLNTSKTEVETLKTQLTNANAELEILKANAVSKVSHEELQTKFNELQTKYTDLETKQKSADQKAMEIVAEQGIPPVPVNPTAAAASVIGTENLIGKLEKLENDPTKQRAFWVEHKEELMKVLRKK